ncbi:DEAD/DEAH box helicase family protein [Dietzia cinnamea]|uniref:DEAD/DEAH box helicase family protein n=1 Tax=Dietzia cinnamea TaxID=321318 RepID=A0AAW5Q834_9ACTN|nr:DEAD/DEAH box helicase family protein [Dietzia cinnamea]MCT2109316.1 DEAD/DEAH box helicase family protein [Dietzia cinnamea]MCT2117326.1 DEAD/DEAH box helicase family protein [Dietzia cinnamea]MCT2173476.1 DEAD/DEAH box helicase family protein [Dietzia cinnamea]
MKLQFKVQQYQTDAVDSVVEVFAGQPKHDGISYRIDPGNVKPVANPRLFETGETPDSGLRNAEIALTGTQLLENTHRVQRSRNLPLAPKLVDSKAAPGAPNLDVEMETGTGKTYVYIKTIMELYKRYGWSKFIIVVPSVAIREGVKKSFDITAEHFQQMYGTKPRSFIYNSSQLHELERFSSDAGVQVMIINIQAFNSSGKDNRRIYDVLDDFQSRRPIDVIKANRPIVIIDEPQKIGADKSLASLAEFNALMVLRYSATHKVEHTKVHRLDALDAYNQKLVKKIAVRGITVKGLAGTTAYLYVDAIEIAKGANPRARVEIEVQTKTGIKRQVKRLDKGDNLHDISGGIEAYKGLFITNIDANRDALELSNGDVVIPGQLADRDVTEETKRRIQIREVIRAHLDKERELFSRGIKVLSLFFIDEVAKYRNYDREDTLGEYARIFEEEYAAIRDDVLGELALDDSTAVYQDYLLRDEIGKVHEGYFSIDKKTKRQVDGKVSGRGDDKGQSTDTDAYDLILKNKERLLSFEEPVRFLFSHSALREGWDNPNVFVMGMLKKSDNTVSRRQEIGRGLRLAVDQHGERMDNPVVVHDINELTVVTDESYTDFVIGLQKEIADSLAARPRKASVKFFAGKTIQTPSGESVVEEALAQALYKYLIKNDYLNDDDTVSEAYKQAKETGTLADPTSEVLRPVIDSVWPLVDALYLDVKVIGEDGRKPKKIPLNEANFAKKEFQALWGRINHKAVYQVEFDSDELIRKCIQALDTHLNVAAMQYVLVEGQQKGSLDTEDLTNTAGFDQTRTRTHTETVTAGSQVKYDLLGEITEKTQLTRRTVAAILGGATPTTFAKFRLNPEQFITETARLVNEQKAAMIVEHLSYDMLEDRFDSAIFTENQTKQDFTQAGDKLRKHVYDYVVTDSKIERDFVTEIDTSNEVAVYAKLPRGFFIPTPVGDYNPDWAIAFTEGSVKHVYFVAETKGSLSTLQLKGVENAKIECARKFFDSLTTKNGQDVTYNVVTDYTELMRLVTT